MKPCDGPPPSWIEELLAASLPEGEVRDGIIGDLREDFLAVRTIRGGPKASVWYLTQAGRVGLRYLADRSWRALRGRETPGKGPGQNASSNWEMKMDDVWRDIRFATRAFVRSPGFFAVAIATLALGIGGTTAIFSVVNGVLLKPLEYRDSGRIMQLGHGGVDGSFSMSVITPGNFFDWSFTNGVESRQSKPAPVSIHRFPKDESVYGALNMAGNAEEWCDGDFDKNRGLKSICGGGWDDMKDDDFQLGEVDGDKANIVEHAKGFRVVRLHSR